MGARKLLWVGGANFRGDFGFGRVLVALTTKTTILLPMHVCRLFTVVSANDAKFCGGVGFDICFVCITIIIFATLLVIFSELYSSAETSEPTVYGGGLLKTTTIIVTINATCSSTSSVLSFSTSYDSFSDGLSISFVECFFSGKVFTSLFRDVFKVVTYICFVIFTLSCFGSGTSFASCGILTLTPLF